MKTLQLFLVDLTIEHVAIIVLATALVTVFAVLPYMRGGMQIESNRPAPNRMSGIILVIVSVGVFYFARESGASKYLNRESEKSEMKSDDRVSADTIKTEIVFDSVPKMVRTTDVTTRYLYNGFAFQVLATVSSVTAHNLANSIDHQTIVEPEDGLFKVLVVGFDTSQQAKEYERTCGRKGYVRSFSYWR